MATRYNIVTPKKYERNGEEKTAWLQIGKLVRFPATEQKGEGYIMELNMFSNLILKVFEEKKKEDKKQGPVETTVEYPNEDPGPNDVGF